MPGGEREEKQSPIKVVITVCKMLKPEKWQSTFDSNGKVSGFWKALKLIVLGGVDPSIRPEVWEFLLGCYTMGTAAEFWGQLRTARRERYKDLIKKGIVNKLRIADVPETPLLNATSNGGAAGEDRVSEWLWTLH